MFQGVPQPGRTARTALAACALAGLTAVAGCGSGGSGGSGSSQPSWARALGSGVTVLPPGSATPGNGSPNAVMIGVITAITTGHIADFCKYEPPAQQSKCNAQMSQVTPAKAKGYVPTFKNMKLGYTAIDGTKALIGLTGTICVPQETPSCFTNRNPARILDSGKPFGELWTQSLKAAANVYSLSPAEEINGKWYAYATS